MNPRRSCPLTRFRGVLARPLGDSTVGEPSGRLSRRPVRRRTSRSSSAALVREHAADHLGPVVEPAVPYDVPQRADRAGLGVDGAVDDPVDPGQHQPRPRTSCTARASRRACSPSAASRRSAAPRSARISACAVGSPVSSRSLKPSPTTSPGRRRHDGTDRDVARRQGSYRRARAPPTWRRVQALTRRAAPRAPRGSRRLAHARR